MARLSRQAFGKSPGTFVPDQVPTSTTFRPNRRNALSKDLVFFGVCHNGDFINYAPQSYFIDPRPAVQDRTDQRGRGYRTGVVSTSRCAFSSRGWDEGLPEVTYLFKTATIGVTSGTNGNAFCSGNGSPPDFNCYYTTTNDRFAVAFRSTDSQAFFQSQTLGDQKYISYAANSNVISGNDDALIDLSDAFDAKSGTGPYDSGGVNGVINVGNRNAKDRPYNGTIEYAVIFARRLTRDEIIQFQKNPYQVLEPA